MRVVIGASGRGWWYQVFFLLKFGTKYFSSFLATKRWLRGEVIVVLYTCPNYIVGTGAYIYRHPCDEV